MFVCGLTECMLKEAVRDCLLGGVEKVCAERDAVIPPLQSFPVCHTHHKNPGCETAIYVEVARPDHFMKGSGITKYLDTGALS